MKIAREAGQRNVDLSFQLLRCAAQMRESGVEPEPRRLLAVLSQAHSHAPITYAVLPYMRSSDPRVRSQAARLIARSGASLEWTLRHLADPDARVRANIVEGIAASPEPRRLLEALRRAAQDPHHRVATTALVVLIRLGEEAASDTLRKIAAHPDPRFRCAAAWAMGELGRQEFEPLLRGLREDPSHAVRFCALRALIRYRRRAS
ncbi:MAG: HEAT repeat domain-containing protein [Bryobacterales bacterium]|nr:HEAT repeat domain-containing protein [Bryobacteraceae bacterium]MDW8353728.1 HEAT repeat domain-containing protein [Bryobacterales bacterium]